MQTEMDKPDNQPIIEPWRVAAIVLIVAVAMLFVHAVEPAGAGTGEPGLARHEARITPQQPARP